MPQRAPAADAPPGEERNKDRMGGLAKGLRLLRGDALRLLGGHAGHAAGLSDLDGLLLRLGSATKGIGELLCVR